MASSPLRDYNRKRNFTRTVEPRGKLAGSRAKKLAGHLFVVHKHAARRLHYDLRLENDGVFVSWAVPKGIPETADRNHLAVMTEDHPLSYGTFEGTIRKVNTARARSRSGTPARTTGRSGATTR